MLITEEAALVIKDDSGESGISINAMHDGPVYKINVCIHGGTVRDVDLFTIKHFRDQLNEIISTVELDSNVSFYEDVT